MLDRKGYRYAIVGIAIAEALFLIGASTIVAVGHEVPKELWAVGTAIGGGLLGILVPRPEATQAPASLVESSTVHNAATTAAAASTAAAVASPRHAAAGPDETYEQAGARIERRVEEAVADIGSSENSSYALAAASGKPGSGAAAGALAARHHATARGLEAQAMKESPARSEELMAQAKVYRAAAEGAQSPVTLKAASEAAQAAPPGTVKISDYVAKLAPPVLIFAAALALGTLLLVGAIHLGANYRPHAIKEGEGLITLAVAAGGAVVGVLAPSPGQSASGGQQPAKS